MGYGGETKTSHGENMIMETIEAYISRGMI